MSTRIVQMWTSKPGRVRARHQVGRLRRATRPGLTGTTSASPARCHPRTSAISFKPSPSTIAARADELNQPHRGLPRSSRRLPCSNDWMKTGASRRFQPCFCSDASSGSSSGSPMPAEVRRVLGLGIDADRTAAGLAELLRELDDFVERRDLELAVVGVRAERQPLARAERLDLGEREVFGEPARDRLAVDRSWCACDRETDRRRRSCRRFRSRAARSARRLWSRRDPAR